MLNLPPTPPNPPPANHEKCKPLEMRAARLAQLAEELRQNVELARSANSNVAIATDLGLVFFQLNALAGSVLGVISPAQNALDLAKAHVGAFHAELASGTVR